MSREFSTKFKKLALKTVEEQDGNLTTAAKLLNIPDRVLACWVRRNKLDEISWDRHKSTNVDNLPASDDDVHVNSSSQKRNASTRSLSSSIATATKPQLSKIWCPGYRRRHGMYRRPYYPDELKTLLMTDSRMVFNFLTTMQRFTTQVLKLQPNQMGTMYPIDVEICLPDALHHYCNFDLLKPDGTPSPYTIAFSVLLAATASGEKLKPVMLVEGIPAKGDSLKLPHNVSLVIKENTALDMQTFAKWKKEIWLETVDNKTLLVMQMDKTDSTLRPVYRNVAFFHESTMLAVIPNSIMHLVHPAIAFWINPFAEKLRVRLLEWLEDSEGAFLTFHEKRTFNYELFAVWVTEAWEEITSEMIVDSFEACGLTNFTPGVCLHAELQEFLNSRTINTDSAAQATQIAIVDLVSDDSNS